MERLDGYVDRSKGRGIGWLIIVIYDESRAIWSATIKLKTLVIINRCAIWCHLSEDSIIWQNEIEERSDFDTIY
jgi:hypothetical protein